MRFIIVALALMAMFSTASAEGTSYTYELGDLDTQCADGTYIESFEECETATNVFIAAGETSAMGRLITWDNIETYSNDSPKGCVWASGFGVGVSFNIPPDGVGRAMFTEQPICRSGTSSQDTGIDVTFVGAEACTPETPCGDGEGDCDGHVDCQDGFYCWERNAGETLDGYNLGQRLDTVTDFCVAGEAPANQVTVEDLGWNGCSDTNPCQDGQGDCDSDDQCAGDLVCFERDYGQYLPGYDNNSVHGGFDYCVTQDAMLTQTITDADCDIPCPVGQWHYGGCDSYVCLSGEGVFCYISSPGVVSPTYPASEGCFDYEITPQGTVCDTEYLIADAAECLEAAEDLANLGRYTDSQTDISMEDTISINTSTYSSGDTTMPSNCFIKDDTLFYNPDATQTNTVDTNSYSICKMGYNKQPTISIDNSNPSAGADVTLTCNDGDAFPATFNADGYTFYKDGVLMTGTDGSSSHIIASITQDDDQTSYSCKTTNTYAESPESESVTIDIAQDPWQEIVTSWSKNAKCAGDELKYYGNWNTLEECKAYCEATEECNFIVMTNTSERCFTFDVCDETQSSNQSVKVWSYTRPVTTSTTTTTADNLYNNKPGISADKDDASAGDYVTFKCRANANPTATSYKFFKDGWKESNHDSTDTLVVEWDNGESGVYTCTATNELGESETSDEVLVTTDGWLCHHYCQYNNSENKCADDGFLEYMGNTYTLEECQQACLDEPLCNFIWHISTNSKCTLYETCDPDTLKDSNRGGKRMEYYTRTSKQEIDVAVGSQPEDDASKLNVIHKILIMFFMVGLISLFSITRYWGHKYADYATHYREIKNSEII